MTEEVKKRRMPLPPPNRAAGLCAQVDHPAGWKYARAANKLALCPAARLMVPDGGYIYRPLIRSTLVKDFCNCKRYFMYEYRLGLFRPAHYVPSLSIGGLFHTALENLIKGVSLADADKCLRVEVNQTETAMEQVTDAMGYLPDGRRLDDMKEKLEKDRGVALAMAQVYTKHYGSVPSGTELATAPEERITAQVTGLRTLISGRLDLLLVDQEDPTIIWIKDYKTTSGVPALIAGALTYDIQPHLYRLLAMARFPDSSVAGCIHSIIQKPGIRFCSKDKTFEDYIKRVYEWYLDKERQAAVEEQNRHPAPSFPVRQSTTYFLTASLPPDLWSLLHAVDRACQCKLDPLAFPRRPDNYICTGQGRGSACKYLPLCCQSDGAMLDMWIGPPGSGRTFEQRNPVDGAPADAPDSADD